MPKISIRIPDRWFGPELYVFPLPDKMRQRKTLDMVCPVPVKPDGWEDGRL